MLLGWPHRYRGSTITIQWAKIAISKLYICENVSQTVKQPRLAASINSKSHIVDLLQISSLGAYMDSCRTLSLPLRQLGFLASIVRCGRWRQLFVCQLSADGVVHSWLSWQVTMIDRLTTAIAYRLARLPAIRAPCYEAVGTRCWCQEPIGIMV